MAQFYEWLKTADTSELECKLNRLRKNLGYKLTNTECAAIVYEIDAIKEELEKRK